MVTQEYQEVCIRPYKTDYTLGWQRHCFLRENRIFIGLCIQHFKVLCKEICKTLLVFIVSKKFVLDVFDGHVKEPYEMSMPLGARP